MGDDNVYISIVNLTNAFDVRSNIIADINLTQLKCNTNEAWIRLTHSILNLSTALFYEKSIENDWIDFNMGNLVQKTANFQPPHSNSFDQQFP